MNQYRLIIEETKRVLANAYVQLHKPNRTSRQIMRYSGIIEDCQQKILFNMFRISHL